MIGNSVEDGDGDGVDGNGIIERRGGFGAFDNANDVAFTGTEVVVGDEGELAGDGLHFAAGVVELCGVERVGQQPTPAFVGGVLKVEGDSTDDLAQTHGV